jgi:hypothetical protein
VSQGNCNITIRMVYCHLFVHSIDWSTTAALFGTLANTLTLALGQLFTNVAHAVPFTTLITAFMFRGNSLAVTSQELEKVHH